jgi:pimeloyl-ACP methyl ester carboxylesterase
MLESAEAVYNDFPNYEEVKFKCPVLLLLGEFDKLGYVKRYNEMWNRETGYPLVIIPKASHDSMYDNYQEFNRITHEFLEKEVFQ